VDDIALILVSLPDPVPSGGQFYQALLGTFSQAPKLRRHIDLYNTMYRQQQTIEKQRKLLEAFQHEAFADAVPFALGKRHDIGRLVKRQQRYIQLLRDLAMPPETASLVQPIIKGIEGLSASLDVIRKSLGTIRDLQACHPRPLSLHKALNDVLSYTSDVPDVASRITVVRKYLQSPDLKVMADPDLLDQVFFNLIDNAHKALQQVAYRTPTVIVDAKGISDTLAEITFKDNGTGIFPDDESRIFSRYFTTSAQGTGLGLYYSHVIISKLHQGTLSFKTTWGYGTTFSIQLKRAVLI
jgi:signal transduction histidine kinase